MNGPLEYGEKIPLVNHNTIEVIDFLSEGGQAWIYLCTGRKVLKWYKSYDQDQYDHISALTELSKPSSFMTWPLVMTEKYKDSFGYVMERIPGSYQSLNNFIYGDDYLNLEDMLRTAYCLISACTSIHQKYIFQDLNPEGIFVNKKNHTVILCDSDNCSKDGKIFVKGKPGYIASEVVIGKSDPNIYTDYYSLAVILFQIFYGNHPLKGKKVWSKVRSAENEYRYFGLSPLFVCDPVNHANGFYGDYTKTVEKRWHKMFPGVLDDTFEKAFTSGLTSPMKRITDEQWMDVIETCYGMLVHQRFCSLDDERYFKLKGKYTTLLCKDKVIYEDQFGVSGYLPVFRCHDDTTIEVLTDHLMLNKKKLVKGQLYRVSDADTLCYKNQYVEVRR